MGDDSWNWWRAQAINAVQYTLSRGKHSWQAYPTGCTGWFLAPLPGTFLEIAGIHSFNFCESHIFSGGPLFQFESIATHKQIGDRWHITRYEQDRTGVYSRKGFNKVVSWTCPVSRLHTQDVPCKGSIQIYIKCVTMYSSAVLFYLDPSIDSDRRLGTMAHCKSHTPLL